MKALSHLRDLLLSGFCVFGIVVFILWAFSFVDIKPHKNVTPESPLLTEDNEFFEILTTSENDDPYFAIQKVRDKKSGAEYTIFLYDNGGQTFIDEKGGKKN